MPILSDDKAGQHCWPTEESGMRNVEEEGSFNNLDIILNTVESH